MAEKYKRKNNDILKGGHTMFLDDVVADLNRKSYLEDLYAELRKKYRWVKVSDRLPEVGKMVDVYTDYTGRMTDYRYEGKGIFYNNSIDDTKEVNYSETDTKYNVTYWMYSPGMPDHNKVPEKLPT